MAENMPETGKQHPVPQQVLGVEYKLVGDLTLKQFLSLAFLGALGWVILVSNVNILFKLIVGGGFFALGLLLAFVPIQDQPFDKWIIYFIKAVYSPTRRFWVKEANIPEIFLTETFLPAGGVETGIPSAESKARLEEYLESIRGEGEKTALDVEEEEFFESVKAIYQKIPTPVPPPAPVELEEKEEAEETPQPLEIELEEVEEEKEAAPELPEPKKEEREIKPRPEAEREKEVPKPKIEAPKPKPPQPIFPKRKQAAPQPKLASQINYTLEPIIKVQRGSQTQFTTAFKNVRVGRKLKFLPVGETFAAAPVRETVIEPVEEGAQELQRLRQEMEKLKPTPTQPQEVKPDVEGTVNYYKQELEKLKQENKAFQENLGKLPSSYGDNQTEEMRLKLEMLQKEKDELAKKLNQIRADMGKFREMAVEAKEEKALFQKRFEEEERKLQHLSQEKQKAEVALSSLQKQLEERKLPKAQEAKPADESEGEEEAQQLKVVKAPQAPKDRQFIKTPNVISGTVKDVKGRVIEGAIVVIKDVNGDPKRALKTNELGQFATSTPLPNGRYRVEIIGQELTFDIMEVELTGAVLSPLIFKGR